MIGILVAKEGKHVSEKIPRDLSFASIFKNLKIYESKTIQMTVPAIGPYEASNVEYTFDNPFQDKVPIVIVYAQMLGTNWQELPAPYSAYYFGSYTYNKATRKFTIRLEQSDIFEISFPAWTATVRYYIFENDFMGNKKLTEDAVI